MDAARFSSLSTFDGCPALWIFYTWLSTCCTGCVNLYPVLRLFAFCNGTNYNTEPFGPDALHEPFQPVFLFFTFDFLRNRNAVRKGTRTR